MNYAFVYELISQTGGTGGNTVAGRGGCRSGMRWVTVGPSLGSNRWERSGLGAKQD